MSKGSVDVLVTFYNQEKYVDDALRSILSQKGDLSLRVLIGDDGSNDNTPTILNKWKEKYPDRIVVFTMPRVKNDNLPGSFRAARNRLNLLKHVTADYFTFLDGDDYYDNDEKLLKQVEILEKPENRDCVACGHAIDALYNDGTRKPFARVSNPKDKYSLKEYWVENYCSTDTIMFRWECISALPNIIPEDIFNDNGITFLFLHKGKIYYLPASMVVYRQTNDGIWTGENKIVNMIREMMFYDFVIKYDPDLKYETRVRYGRIWKSFCSLKGGIPLTERIEPYVEEVRKQNYRYTMLWINRGQHGIMEYIVLYQELFLITLSRTLFKIKQMVNTIVHRD